MRACRLMAIVHGVFARGLQGNASSTKANNLAGPREGWANACNKALRIIDEARTAPKL